MTSKLKIAVFIALIVLFTGCLNDKKSGSDNEVESGVENFFSYVLGYTVGDIFQGIENRSFIPADGVSEAVLAFDYR